MANQPSVTYSHDASLLAASGTEATGAETRVLTSSLIGTHQGLDVMLYGTPAVSASFSGGTDVNVFTGTQQTLGTVGTVIGLGTATNLGSITNVGQIHNAGTVQSARIDFRPVGSAVLSTHTLGTGGGTFVGTLVAPSGAGTSLYLSGLSIVVHSGTVDCGIANNVAGTTGAGVYARGQFVPSAGIMREFIPAINLGTNGTVAYFMISAGTVSFTANYWSVV